MARCSPILAVALLCMTGACATTRSEPQILTAGVKPTQSQADLAVNTWLATNAQDPDNIGSLRISDVREGTIWYGVRNGGAVPSWYVCADYDEKLSSGGYAGVKPHVMWIRGTEVVHEQDARERGMSEFTC